MLSLSQCLLLCASVAMASSDILQDSVSILESDVERALELEHKEQPEMERAPDLQYVDAQSAQMKTQSLCSMVAHSAQGVYGDDPNKVYVGNGETMDKVEQNMNALNGRTTEVNTFVSVAGSMSALNLLLKMDPAKLKFISLFDVNCHQVDFAQLLLKMVLISGTRTQFMENFFGRDLAAFEATAGPLTENNQMQWLSTPAQPNRVQQTKQQIADPKLQQLFSKFVEPQISAAGKPFTNNGAVFHQRLLPCYPIPGFNFVATSSGDNGHTYAPSGGAYTINGGKYNFPATSKKLVDENGVPREIGSGAHMPNTGTWFYGHGWLQSEGNFQHVKACIQNAKLKLTKFDVLKDGVDTVLPPKGAGWSPKVVINLSNIGDFFQGQMPGVYNRWTQWAKSSSATLHILNAGSLGVGVQTLQ